MVGLSVYLRPMQVTPGSTRAPLVDTLAVVTALLAVPAVFLLPSMCPAFRATIDGMVLLGDTDVALASAVGAQACLGLIARQARAGERERVSVWPLIAIACLGVAAWAPALAVQSGLAPEAAAAEYSLGSVLCASAAGAMSLVAANARCNMTGDVESRP